MTPTGIIAMAHEVGVKEYGPNTRNWSFDLSQLERFAALLAVKAAADEREACANHVEDCESPIAVHGNRVEIGIVTRVAYANSIRARSPK